MKLGYVQTQTLIDNMSDYQRAQTALDAYKSELSSTLQSKMKEYQQKLSAFQLAKDTLNEVLLKDKESELQHLQNSAQEFEENANESFNNRERELFEPIETKITTAIEQVANEQGYTHILPRSSFIFVKGNSDDITVLVANKLGVELGKTVPSQGNQGQ